jgi:transmembrane sensor
MKEFIGKIDLDVLKRFIQGAATVAEINQVKQWFADENLKEQLTTLSVEIWEQFPVDADVPDLNGSRILDRIHHRINIEDRLPNRETTRIVIFMRQLSRVAAILLLPALLLSLYLFLQMHDVNKDISYSEIYAPVGTRASFVLPDGTTGWLNGGSTLTFPNRFQQKTREIKLSGEVFLNVLKDDRKPFLVSTSNLMVKVLGTSLNVMAYDDAPLTEVTLVTGSVKVLKRNEGELDCFTILQPNQSLMYFHENDSTSLIQVSSYNKIAWKDGKLVFRYEPLSEVIVKINRWYDVNIQILNPELKDHLYYGTFHDETLDELLKLLQLTAPIRIRDLGREIRVDGTYEKRRLELY